MDRSEVVSSVDEAQEWVKRIKRALMFERDAPGSDPRMVNMLIENLEAELRKLAQLVNQLRA